MTGLEGRVEKKPVHGGGEGGEGSRYGALRESLWSKKKRYVRRALSLLRPSFHDLVWRIPRRRILDLHFGGRRCLCC